MMQPPVYIHRMASIHAAAQVKDEPYLTACEPDYKEIITNPTLRRRMSRIIKMGVACGLQCIGTTPPEQIQAIITATGLGCLIDTEKFMNAIIDQEERMLNPTPFIQSTFNTMGAQIALICQIHAYNVTYVHRGLSFESALLDAMMRIWEGNENVLIGAIDEITPTSYTIQKRLGLLRGTQAGEGTQFFLLGQQATPDTLAEINGVETFRAPASTQEVTDRISAFLQRQHLTAQDIGCFVTGKNGNEQQDAIYTELEQNLFPQATYSTFKDQCGEYHTASAYAVWQVAKAWEDGTSQAPISLIYNHYRSVNHSLILMRKSV